MLGTLLRSQTGLTVPVILCLAWSKHLPHVMLPLRHHSKLSSQPSGVDIPRHLQAQEPTSSKSENLPPKVSQLADSSVGGDRIWISVFSEDSP